ncbi:hypothetical protein C8A01DRAFT_36789 [Parachaetomium inaequale]|uniref:Uncharacterized protein n=1 Tax=Parachaetomium inaequale TaxID=2588326 RepID=A0AAN6SQD6_9PEZI|nr:hypothetical protein C8A01DRAFT_36789 [Parachaetomium inaequale]
MDHLLTIARTTLAHRLRLRNALLDVVLCRELARQGVLYRAGAVDLGLGHDRVNAARGSGGGGCNRGGDRGGSRGGSREGNRGERIRDGSGGDRIGDGSRWRVTAAFGAARPTWCALVLVESPDCEMGRRWEGRLVMVSVQGGTEEGGGRGVSVRMRVLRATCLCAGVNTGAGTTRPKTEAEIEADKVYEEAMEEEYAKREGGA